jgi:hypothetical protein
MDGFYNDQAEMGLFTHTTSSVDVQNIYSTEVTSKEFKELIIKLYQDIGNISGILNAKDSGKYVLQEFVNGQIFFPNPLLNSTTPTAPTDRQVFRKVINFGSLPNAAAKSVAHGLSVTPGYSATRIYGAATNNTQTSFIPLPFASPTLNENIKLEMTNTNVVVTTGIDRTAYTTCYLIVEYIKQ